MFAGNHGSAKEPSSALEASAPSVGFSRSEGRLGGAYFIKVGVTIENAYGNTIRTYAQGVSGNGNVSDFYVSL